MLSEPLRQSLRAALYRASEWIWAASSGAVGTVSRMTTRADRWSSSGGERVVIVAPHPDDETIGAGGVAALHVREGDSVAIVIVTDGGGSRALGLAEEEMALRRAREVEAAAEVLGTVELHRLGLPEWRWGAAELRERLTELLRDADIVYAPSCVDYHPEHVRVARVVAGMLRPGQLVRVYELGVPLTPVLVNRIADIQEVEATKTRALAAFESQRGSLEPLSRLARYRARLYGGGAVEAFWELDASDYARAIEAGNWTRATSPYRGIDGRPILDPLSAIVGLRSRMWLRHVSTSGRTRKGGSEKRRSVGHVAGLWPVLAALAVILPAGAIAAIERFDGLYGQDPFAYFSYATGPLRESLLQLSGPPPFFWPPVYPLLVALTSLAVGPVPLAGQLVSLFAGGLIPVFTALLAREVWPRKAEVDGPRLVVPLIAALAVAFTGQLWQSSTVVMSDTTGLALATAGVWALARYGRRSSAGWLVLAAVLLACATLTRWIYGVVAIPCAVYAVLMLARLPLRRALAHAGGAAACALLLLAPVIGPAIAPLLQRGNEVAPFAGNFQVYSWNPLRALGREFATVDGLLRHDLPNILYFGLAPARWAYFTPLLAPLLLPGAWVALRRRTPALLVLVLGWAFVVFVFHIGAPYQNFRFTLAFLPPLGILLGIGVEALLRVQKGHFARATHCYLALGMALMVVAGTHTTRTLIARKAEYVATTEWARSQMPSEARLLAFGITLTFRHYSDIEVLDLWDVDPSGIAGVLGSERPTFVLADTANLASQWQERAPGMNYRWLRGGPGLTLLGTRGPFSLFRVGRSQVDLQGSRSFVR